MSKNISSTFLVTINVYLHKVKILCGKDNCNGLVRMERLEALVVITLLEVVVNVEAGNDLLRLEQGHVTKVVPLTAHVSLVFGPVLLVLRLSDPNPDGFESGRS